MVHVSLLRRLEGHDWQVSSVAFHPAGDMLASASWDRTVRIWDVDAGRELRVIERTAHTAPITNVAWHPNGALLATTSADNTTCLWDASTGARLKTLKEHFGWVLHCSFAPDRTKLATASWDKTVRLWDPNTGELLSTLRGHTKGVWGCSFYPVGHTSALLATCGDDNTTRLWDTRTRKVALTLSGGHADAVYSVAWSSDGTLLATGSADKTIAIWDPKVGRILRMLSGHDNTVKDLCFSPVEGSNTLASAGGYNAMLWNPKAGLNNALAEMRQHAVGKEVEAVAVSYNGKLIATGSRDGKVCVSTIPDFPKDEFFDLSKQQEKRNWRQNSEPAAPAASQPRRDVPKDPVPKRTQEDSALTAAILQRKREIEKAAAPPEPVRSQPHKPIKTDPSTLLASRGFQQDGTVVAAPATATATPTTILAAPQDTYDSVDFSGPGPAIAAAAAPTIALSLAPPAPPPPSEDLYQNTSSANRLQPVTQASAAHPMVDQFKSATSTKQDPSVPRRQTVSDPEVLMKAMRMRNQAAEFEADTRPVVRPKPAEVKQDLPATVESIMRDSKPLLGQKVKVRSSTYLSSVPEP